MMYDYFFVYIYSNSLHVSNTPVLIIRKINCINTTPGIHVCHSVYVTCQVCRFGFHPNLHT
jgi:hypothetical protein